MSWPSEKSLKFLVMSSLTDVYIAVYVGCESGVLPSGSHATTFAIWVPVTVTGAAEIGTCFGSVTSWIWAPVSLAIEQILPVTRDR